MRWILIIISLYSLQSWALPEDKQAPVQIEADSAELDKAKNTTIYMGNVHIQQGSMELKADKVIVHYRHQKPYLVIAIGQPASFKQKPAPDQPWITGRALDIRYYLDKDEVIFDQQAELWQDEDRIASDRIVYDRVNARLKAGEAAQGKERVKIILRSENLQ